MSRWNISLVAGAALLAAAPFAARYASAPSPASEKPTVVTQPAPKRATSPAVGKIDAANPSEASVIAQSQAELRKNICGFLKEYAGELTKGPPEPYCRSNSERSARVIPAGHTKVVLAILPDPIHTHLALRFDRAVDSIQGSLQRLGWTFDHSWLPWDNRSHNSPDRFNDRLTDDDLRRARDTTPGVLLFRRSDPSDTAPPLVLILVGDTPTSGVNNQQFRNAVAIWKTFALHNVPADPRSLTDSEVTSPNIYPYCGAETHLAILGPTFSGSGQSLKKLIDQELKPMAKNHRVRVSVSSGTISADDQLDSLETAYDQCGNGLHVEPKSFNIDLLYSRMQLLDYLINRNTPGKIMQLVEAESTFGSIEDHSFTEAADRKIDDDTNQLIRYLCRRESTDQDCIQLQRDLAPPTAPTKRPRRSPDSAVEVPAGKILEDKKKILEDNCPPGSNDENCVQLLGDMDRHKNLAERLKDASSDNRVGVLHFPREISRLRKAYEQGGIVNFTSANTGPRTELSFSFGTDTRDDDTVPLFSGSQGDVAMETQMSQIASLLQADHVSTVILSATDVLDEIFVARYLAQHTPDLTVIIQDSDQLFLRQGSDAVMNEIYVATPWPLIEKNQRWASSKQQQQPRSIVHPSLSDQGIYNATQYLLCDPDFTNRSEIQKAALPCQPDRRKGHTDAPNSSTNGIALDEYQPPVPLTKERSLDFKEQPPIWLSVIERGQFTPVSLVDIDNDSRDPKHPLPESSPFNLPRLFESQSKDGREVNDRATTPRGIEEPTALPSKLIATAIMILLLLHTAACLLSRLHRPFAWSYALADKDQHPIRIFFQITLPLFAIPALSLLLIPPAASFSVQSGNFEAFLQFVQILAIAAACSGPLAYFISSADIPRWVPPIPPGSRWNRLRSRAWHELQPRLRWHPSLAVCLLTAFAGMLLTVVCHHLWWERVAPSSATSPAEHLFFIYRSAFLLCGSSPALTLLLLLAALALWTQRMFGRLVFFGNRIPRVPNGHVDLRCPDQIWLRPLTQLLSGWANPTRYILLALSALCVFLLVMQTEASAASPAASDAGSLFAWLAEPRGPRSLAHSSFDLWVAWLAGIVATLIVHDLLMAFTIWTRLSELCLIPLKQSPLRWGFTWIKGFSWRRILTSTQNLSPEQTFDYLMRLIQANERPGGDPDVQTTFNALRTRYFQSPRNLNWVNDVSAALGTVHASLALAGSNRLTALAAQWRQDIGPVTGAGKAAEDLRGLHLELPPDKLEDVNNPAVRAERETVLARMASEEFVALLYLSYIRMVLVQIRNRILTAAWLYVLLLWALTSYPWMNRHAILLALSALLVLMSAVAFVIYSQMHRDHILSRTTETEPGKLDGGFIERLLPVVGVPLLSLVASQFPEVSNFVFSWLEPSLSRMH